ncbi:MAG: PA14 domain-containing protein [Planctomycetota bacterium]|jgi:hypothetical protein
MCRKLLLIAFVLVVGLASNTLAQVPANQDVGNPALAGDVVYDPVADTWTVQGGGADIWGSWDQFHFVYRPLAGDGSASLRIAAMDVTSPWAKAGVMVRETLDGDSKHAAIAMTGSNGIQTLWRSETGGSSASAQSGGVVPWFVRIVRAGPTISTFLSPNGIAWIPHQIINLPMNENVYIGMFVGSVNAGQLNTTVFDNVNLEAPPFPAPWALSPADGLGGVDPAGLTLSWMAGDTAVSHNVYFGTSSPPPLAVNQTETSYDTGALEGLTTYYWQIGEDDGTTEHLGAEQSFTTKRAGTGSILREIWEGIGTVDVIALTSDPDYPSNPTWSDELPQMNTPDLGLSNYGGRMIGLLAPETSGDYTFWIASDDASELWMSTTGKGCDAQKLCEETDCCDDYNDSQKSAPVTLEGGQLYPIWALWKEAGGGDWCRVAWQGPDAPSRTEIDGRFLMPGFADPAASNPSPADGATGVDMAPTLSWVPAADAVSYEVYVDGDLVANTTETSVAAGPFDLATSHTWQVDTVTDSSTVTGCGWSFTVSDSRLIDDFDYDIVPDPVLPSQDVIGGDFTTSPEAPNDEMNVIGGDFTIPGTPEEVLDPVDPGGDALVAYYPLDGDTLDASGSGHDGTAVGDPAVVDGPVGYGSALTFTPDGGDDYVDLGT